MFPPTPGQHKHWSWLLVGLCALSSGCATSWFLHVSPRSYDARLKLLLGGGGNVTMLMHAPGELLVVDTKFAEFSRRLKREAEVELARKVRRIVLTHAHSDHAGGLKLFPEARAVLVHPNARKRLEAEGTHAAYVEVEREVRLQLDGEEVRVLAMGSGHTDGDLVAFFPKRKLLVAGDLMNDGFEPYADPKYGGDILTMSRTLEQLMTLDFETVVPGHGEPMPRAKAQALADYAAAMRAEVAAARKAGKSEDQVAAEVRLPQYPLNAFLFLLSTREANVRAMFQLLGREGKTSP